MPYPTSNLDYGGGVVDNPDASNIDIDDVGGHYDGNTVEEALAELGPVFDNIQGSADVDDAVIAAAISDDTPSASYTAVFANPTFTGNVVVPNAADADTATAAQRTAVDSTLGRLAIDNAEIGDTGYRNVTGDLLNSFTGGNVYLRRDGNTVTVVLNTLTAPGGQTGFLTLPDGFRNRHVAAGNENNRSLWPALTAASGAIPTRWVKTGGGSGETLSVVDAAGATLDAAATVVGTFSFTTSDDWPSSLPGTQATAPLDPTA